MMWDPLSNPARKQFASRVVVLKIYFWIVASLKGKLETWTRQAYPILAPPVPIVIGSMLLESERFRRILD